MMKLKEALSLLVSAAWLAIRRWLTLLILIAGLTALALFFYALLNLPDSHIWTVAISAMAWPALFVAALWLMVAVFHGMRGAVPPLSLKFAIPLLLLWLLLWAVPMIYLAHFPDKLTLYASYLNSRLPAQGRAMLTYERILGLLQDAYYLLQWLLLPGLLLPCMVETVSAGLNRATWRRITSVWRGWVWWFSLFVSYWIWKLSSSILLEWHPRHNVWLELLNAFGRAFAICAIGIALVHFLLSLLVTYMLKATPDGGPETSQPATVEKP